MRGQHWPTYDRQAEDRQLDDLCGEANNTIEERQRAGRTGVFHISTRKKPTWIRNSPTLTERAPFTINVPRRSTKSKPTHTELGPTSPTTLLGAVLFGAATWAFKPLTVFQRAHLDC